MNISPMNIRSKKTGKPYVRIVRTEIVKEFYSGKTKPFTANEQDWFNELLGVKNGNI